MRVIPIVVLALLVTSAAAAQEITINGRAVDRDTREPIAFATITLPNGQVVANRNGQFQFKRRAGRYVIRIAAIGYIADEFTVIVTEDKSVTFELERDPVRLDSLVVSDRRVTFRVEVKDSATGMGLMDADVLATPGRRETTDGIGRVKFTKVPAGVPITIEVAAFGYLRPSLVVESERDTTIKVLLVPDPIVAKMLDAARARIDERSADRRKDYLPVIEHAELMRNRNGPLREFLARKLGSARLGRVSCWVLDEQSGEATRMLIATMLPDRIDRVEVLDRPPARLMVRVYTRDYMRRAAAGVAPLLESDIIKGRVCK